SRARRASSGARARTARRPQSTAGGCAARAQPSTAGTSRPKSLASPLGAVSPAAVQFSSRDRSRSPAYPGCSSIRTGLEIARRWNGRGQVLHSNTGPSKRMSAGSSNDQFGPPHESPAPAGFLVQGSNRETSACERVAAKWLRSEGLLSRCGPPTATGRALAPLRLTSLEGEPYRKLHEP